MVRIQDQGYYTTDICVSCSVTTIIYYVRNIVELNDGIISVRKNAELWN